MKSWTLLLKFDTSNLETECMKLQQSPLLASFYMTYNYHRICKKKKSLLLLENKKIFLSYIIEFNQLQTHP